MYKLFIDDLRNPPDRSFVVVRSYKAAIEYMLEFGCPIYVSFDHDLGEDKNGNICKSGHDIAKWMVEMDIDSQCNFFVNNFSYNVHSANPVGKKNIESLFESYFKYLDSQKKDIDDIGK